MSQEAGLQFWLHYSARNGALSEDDGARALLLLPPAMQQTFHLSEEVAVTADPEVAAEDGALLLIPGHPLLEQAAAQVLERGDAGTGFIPWPRRPRPSPDALLQHARDQFPVEHGRVDLAGEPEGVYLPLLNIGALVTYTVDERFQEREELWLDARTGLPAAGVGRLADLATPDTGHPTLLPDIGLALSEAHRQIEQRAAAREQVLQRQIQGVVQEEAARAGAYYEGVLQSIAQRRGAAPPERQELFEAQAEATQAERGRRLQEIAEKYRPRHEVRPFRLHLILVPALLLPVHVRRGERRYPLALTWLSQGDRFAAVRCPHCRSAASLVAGREYLGCKECLAAPAQPASPSPAKEPAPTAKTAPAPVKKVSPPPAPHARAASAPKPAPQHAPAPVAPAPPVERPEDAAARYQREWERAPKLGQQLAQELWGSASGDIALPRRQVEPHSPLAALYRLYGPAGPLHAVGLPPGRVPLRLSMLTAQPDRSLNTATFGELAIDDDLAYPYSVRWRLGGRHPLVFEVLPFSRVTDDRIPSMSYIRSLAAPHLRAAAPRPQILLDLVAAAVWKVDLPTVGLPLVVRVLAAWWRIQQQAAPLALPPRVLAAALVNLVGQRAGYRRSRPDTAEAYGVEAAAVQAAARQLQPLLNLSAQRAW